MKKIGIILLLVGIIKLSVAQTWLQKNNFTGTSREAGAIGLVNNRLYVGLGGNNTFTNDWFEYNINTDVWQSRAAFPGAKRFAPAYFVLNNKIYVGCGFDQAFNPLQDFYCYDPGLDTWTPVANFGGGSRGGTIHFSVNGKGFVGTGVDNSFNARQDMWKYNDTTNTWTAVNSFPNVRWRMVNFLIGDTVYAGCGANDVAGQTGFWKYNYITDAWVAIANFPGSARVSPFGINVGGFGYVGTGSDFMSGANFHDVYQYMPQSNTWSIAPTFTGGARNSSVYASDGIKGWVCLGNSGTGWKNDLWLFTNINTNVLENEINLELYIYPDPSSDYIEVKGKELHEGTFELGSMEGKIIAKGNIGNKIDVSKIHNGCYFLIIQANNKRIVKKLIVQHNCQ